MNFLRNRITILFLLALLITSGCRIIPWFGNYSDSPDPDIRGEIILSRNVEATQALSFSSPQLKLYIPAGALRYDSRVEITRYPLLLSKLNLPEEYRPASQLFSIDVLPAITTLSQAATLKFSIANAVAGRSYMAAYRGSDEKWKFASPLQQNQTNDLVVETLSFSDWLIVERVKSFPGALAQGMQITASPTAAVASTTGFFEEDIEISLNLHSDNLLSLNQASSILKMQLSNYNKFSLTVANPGAPTTSREFNSDADNSVFIDLLNTSLASAQVEGSNATYTFRIALKGKTPAELPDFLALEALYTTVNGISYSAAQTLTFSEAPDESGDIKPTAPQITDSLPENGANYVASNTEIKIVFDQNMNIDTIQAAIKISDRAGNAVSGSFHWENDRIMVFVPNNLLLPSTEYVIRFVDGATGENGLALVVEGEMVFTTISNEPAELLNYSPENNTLVEYNTPIILSFSQPIDANNLNFTITPEIPGGYATTWNKAKTEVSIIYGSGFASGLVYTVNVLNTSKDIYGQPIIDNYSFSFTSKTYTESRLTVISPASGSVGIAPTSDFVLTFDKAMDHPSVESAITFSPMLTGVVSYVWSPDSMKLTIAHTEKLQLSKDYYLSIAQNDTNLLITSYQISFQTVNALQVIETTPANNTAGVTTAQTVEFRFNNQIDTETLAVSFSPEPTNGFTQSWSDNNTRLLLTPSPALDESRNYQVSILTATSDVYGSTLGQNHVLDFSTGAFTQPQVTSTLPENNSLAVTVNQQIKIYFNKSMDKTKTQAALTIQPFTSPEFSWQDSGKTMLIDFAAPLTAGTTYAFTLNTEATDQTGLKLAQPYTLSLKTAAPDSPNPATLTEYEPTDSSTPVDIFAPVVLRFSAPIDQKTLDFEISPAIAGDFSTTWNEAGTEVSVRFNSGYSSGISYTFSVLATTKDIYGQNIAEPDDFNFTAKTYVATRLIGVSPASGSAGIDPSSTFELTFDQAMNEGDIVAAISFSPALTGAVNYAWSDGSKKLTITHTDKLLLGTNYLVTIAQSYANQLISSYAISYKVAEALQIVETTPEDSSTVTINQPVEFKFNNQIDTETLAVSFSPEPTNGFTQNWSENNTRLLLTPSPALDESRSYQVSILVATKDIYGNSLPQSHILAFSTGAVTQPEVTLTLPANNSLAVAVNQQIRIYFSKSMNKAITQTALNIQPPAIPTFSWQDSDSTMLIDFAAPLSADTTYAFTLSTEATDQTGLKLAQPYTLSLKTAAPDSPDPTTLTGYEPADSSTPVDLFAPVVLRFSAPIDQKALNFEILPTIAGDFSTTWNEAGTEVSVRFNSGYGSGISYTFSVLATTKDIYGQNIAEPDDFNFTAETYVATRLIGVSPASGSVGIAPSSTFELTFDQGMNESEVVNAISYSPALTGTVNYAWSDGSKKLSITHTDKLLLGTNYLITIAQSYANRLISSYAISYKVAEALQVVENTPENNAAGVTTSQNVKFIFNNPINTGTLALSFSPEPTNGFTQSWSDNNRILLLTPNNPGLVESTSYQVSILVATEDIYGNSLPQSHILAFSTGAVTQPEVTSTLPANNSLAVAVSQQIKIYFSKSMNKAITQTALSIQPPVSPTFSWQDSDSTMLMDFAAPLAADTTYAFTLSTEATDQTGLKLAQPYTLSFKTAAPDSPDLATLTGYEPADNSTPVDLFAPVVLRFSAPIDQETLNFEISPPIAGDFSTTWNEAGTEVSVRFNSGYSSGISYTFSVLATTKDIYGQNIAESYDFNFTAITYVAARLIGTIPASGTAGIAPDSTFELTFDQAMNESDVVNAISFSPALTGAVNYAWSDGSKKLTITHTDKLLLGTNYLITIAQSYANRLISSYAISYKVAEALQVVETTPESASTVTTSQPVEFKFNNPINTETLALAFSPEPANGFTQNWSDNNRIVLLTPNDPGLVEATSYQVSVLVATKDIYGNSLPQNHVLAFSTSAVTPPMVTSTLPENSSLAVAVNQQIKIYFSRSMNKAITQTALNIQPSVIPTFSWQDSDSTMLIDFATPLAADTTYAFTLSTEATDQTGLKLAQPYTLSFKTDAPDSPDPATLTEYEPADTSTPVDLFAPVVLRFSAPIDQRTLNFEILPAIAGDFSTTWNEASTEVSVRFNSGYGSGISYTFSVLATTKDIYGQNIAEPDDFSFTAKTYVATRLIGVSPASGSAGIDPGSTFELTFDQAMNEGDVVSAISFSPALTGAVNYAWSDGSKKLTITHTDKLLLGTNYLLTIAQSYANQLISSYAISYKVAEALQIVENTPENNSAGVTTNQAVEFKFNNQINTETLALSFSPEPANGFTKSWSDNNRTLLLTPNSPGLAESTNYQVSVLVATKDIYGNSLPQNHVLAFSTGAVTPPAISSTFPLAGSYDVAVDQQIKIYFSKSMDREKTQAAVSLSPSVTPVFNWLDGDTTMIISVGDALSYDTSYQITIGTGATDKYGLSIEQGHLFGFKTVARPTVLVSKSYPLTNSTGIPPQAVIKIEFSKTMNKESAQTAFSLKQVSTSVNGSFSWSGNIMSFTPSASLAYGATYQISIAASAADSLGNSLAAAISWSFATAADEGKVWALEQANTENTTTFSQRSEHVMISFNNKLWVIGGFDGISYLNDIWSSSDGKSWTNETAAAAFPARSGHACIVYNGKIWMTGGYSYTDTDKFFDDVWSSSDGKNWVQVSNSADYYARSAHSMAVFADKLWIIGGETFDESNNLMLLDDCWSSSNGSSWQLRSTMVSFFPRKLHISGVINNRLWVWSGYGENSNSVEGALNDAWSTADGDYWRLETSNTAFPARCAAGYATFNNRTWLIGGANGDPYQAGTTYYNDIWASSDGTNWVQILGNSAGSATQFSPRVLHSAAALSDKLFISGGELASYYLNNEVWSTK